MFDAYRSLTFRLINCGREVKICLVPWSGELGEGEALEPDI